VPKALSGEILADPVVLIDRRQHYSFNRRVKARGAQSACFERDSSQHIAASDSDPGERIDGDARSRALVLTRASIRVTGFSASSRSQGESGGNTAGHEEG